VRVAAAETVLPSSYRLDLPSTELALHPIDPRHAQLLETPGVRVASWQSKNIRLTPDYTPPVRRKATYVTLPPLEHHLVMCGITTFSLPLSYLISVHPVYLRP
jgi:hypothetical protein